MSLEISGFFGFLFFLVIIWAIYKTIKSSASPGNKTLWVLAILLLPVLGLIAWLFLGPKGS